MTSAIYDFKAIRAKTLAFPKDHPQDVVKPVEKPEPTYSYSSDDLSDQPDYGMFAGYTYNGETFTIPSMLPVKAFTGGGAQLGNNTVSVALGTGTVSVPHDPMQMISNGNTEYSKDVPFVTASFEFDHSDIATFSQPVFAVHSVDGTINTPNIEIVTKPEGVRTSYFWSAADGCYKPVGV